LGYYYRRIDMGRVLSDGEKMIKAAELSSRGHHRKAAGVYRKMANEERSPRDKENLRSMADKSISKSR
jgi:hypothetical protein